MKDGEIVQIGSPKEIYMHPANTFVAGFIGISNFLSCRIEKKEGSGARVTVEEGYSFDTAQTSFFSGEAILSARPEQLSFDKEGIPGKIVLSTFLGDFIEYEVEIKTGKSIQVNEYTKDTQSLREDGAEVFVNFDKNLISLFDAETREVIG